MFEFGEKSFLGIDIGMSAIKAVEIKLKENRPFIANYALMKMPETVGDINALSFEKNLPIYLERFFDEANFAKKKVFMSIHAFGSLMSLIEIPDMPEEDMEQAVRLEAHKYIPTSLDEVVLSWGVTSSEKKDQASDNKTQILLVAVSKEKVLKYEELAKKIGLRIDGIEIESFSLVRSLVGKDPGNFVIVEMGSRVCSVILVEKGDIKVGRNIDAGGKDITSIIASGMSIDIERAEKLKVSGTDFFGKDSNIVLSPIDMIIEEVERIVNSYYGSNSVSENIDGIILSGGTASLTGIVDYFSKKLNVKTIKGNPFGRVQYDKRLESKIKEISPQMSIAIGLALKGLDK